MLNAGEVVIGQSWHWSDNCSPQDGSGTVTVTTTAPAPGMHPSKVDCSILWSIADSATGKIVRAVVQKCHAETSVDFGVLWSAGKLSGGAISSPQDQRVTPAAPTVVVAAPGSKLQCSCSPATAVDQFTFAGAASTVPATITYMWKCSVGSFESSRTVTTSTSPSPTWYAPTLAQTAEGATATISLIASGSSPIASYDGGSRTSDSLKESVTAYVPAISVIGGAFGPSNVYVGQTVSADVTAKIMPLIPGTVDHVDWSSNVLWFSRIGTVGSFRPYFGGNAFTSASHDLAGTFAGRYLDPGYYMLEVTARDTIKDNAQNVLCTVAGQGIINGSWNFIDKKAALSSSRTAAGKAVDKGWFQQPFTSDNKVYALARQEVEQEAARSSYTKAALEYWQKEVDDAVPSPLDMYRAGYAVWLESKAQTSTEIFFPPQKIIPDVEHEAGSRVQPDWRSYEYVRMRFLFQSAYDPNSSLIEAGQRLLSAKPSDPDVIGGMLRLLNIGVDPQETRQAFDLCNRLIKLAPNAAGTYKVVASVYYTSYAWNDDAADRESVLVNLRKFMLLSSPNDPFIAFAEDRIAQLSAQT